MPDNSECLEYMFDFIQICTLELTFAGPQDKSFYYTMPLISTKDEQI